MSKCRGVRVEVRCGLKPYFVALPLESGVEIVKLKGGKALGTLLDGGIYGR